jgi:hypothetical protein
VSVSEKGTKSTIGAREFSREASHSLKSSSISREKKYRLKRNQNEAKRIMRKEESI